MDGFKCAPETVAVVHMPSVTAMAQDTAICQSPTCADLNTAAQTVPHPLFVLLLFYVSILNLFPRVFEYYVRFSHIKYSYLTVR